MDGSSDLDGGMVADGGMDSGPPLSPTDQCLALPFNGPDECRACRCAMCTQLVLLCGGAVAGGDANCNPLVACARDAECTDETCSCGTSPGCVAPNGVCANELTTAASAAGLSPAECNTDPTCGGYQALRVSECVGTQCYEECWEDQDGDD